MNKNLTKTTNQKIALAKRYALKKKKSEFLIIMHDLSWIYHSKFMQPGKENKVMRDHFIKDYHKALGGFSTETLRMGIDYMKENRTDKYFPVPGEIKEACRIALRMKSPEPHLQLPSPKMSDDEILLGQLSGKYAVYLLKIGRGKEYTEKERNEYVVRKKYITKANLANLIRRIKSKRSENVKK